MHLKPTLAALSAGALLTLTGCATGMTGSPQVLDSAVASVQQAAEAAATFTMNGGLVLYDVDTTRAGCFPELGYSDIGFGTVVTVSDATGRKIAVGRLDFGINGQADGRGPGTCVFAFTIPDVPAGSKFYDVEVAHRGAVTFTQDEAYGYVGVTLGD